MMSHQTVIVLDFGGQYNQLIARRVRECGVYCEVKPYTTSLDALKAMEPIGFIFTGGPNSVYDEKAPHVDPAIFELGVPEYLVMRQPFPGPGLAIRVIGDLTKEKLDTLRDADAIYREEIAAAGEDKNINQYFAVLTNTRSVGVMGDGRTYDYTLALRAVTTSDFMTADWARIPYDVLDRISTRIVNEVPGINRIVYDITSKPPATIEWE